LTKNKIDWRQLLLGKLIPFVLSRCAGPLLVILVWSVSGCTDPVQHHSAPVADQNSFDDQLRQVAAGVSDTIAVAAAVVTDADLRKLDAALNLRQLLLDNTSVTDEGVAYLTQLPNLYHLRMRGARLTDRGMESLAKIRSLRFLNIPQAAFTDQGLKELLRVSDLQQLRFSSPHVTDEGMKYIGQMKSLRFLHLIAVPITDAGLEEITKLSQLESLYLDEINVSDNAVAALFEAIPDLHFHLNDAHVDRK
jgi:hypothetical protein